MNSEMQISIAGGGIGGLTAAIALARKGFSVQVFEQSPRWEAPGAGIVVAANAMQVLDRLGCGDAVRASGNEIQLAEIRKQGGSILSTLPIKELTASIGTSSWAIHRGDLQSALLNEARNAGVRIFTDHRLHLVSKDMRMQLEFTNGNRTQCHLLIGADGIHSVVREYVLGKTAIRSAGQSCWRGVVERSSWSRPWPSHTACEFLGSGSRLGIVPIDGARIYWYATVSESRGIAPSDLAGFYKFFTEWNEFSDIINLPQGAPIGLPLADRPPVNRWFRDTVVLLGDAVHSTTPNMGQGACMAIESAYVLADLLSEFELDRALPAYQKKRYGRTSQVNNRSFQLGRIAQTENRFAAFFRDRLMRGLQGMQRSSARSLLLGGPANAKGA